MEPRYQGGTINRTGATTSVDVDQGLRAYMLKIYNYMTLALGITGGVALLTSQLAVSSPAVQNFLFVSPLKWVILLAPLAMVFFLSARINKMSATAAHTTFWSFAALMGISLASIFLIYTGMSIAKVFFMTAAMFGSMSLYGYTTKRDLSKLGAFLFMGLIGLIIAVVVNLFLQSPALHFAISIIGILIFVGLTAWDTQKIKSMYVASDGHDVVTRKSIMGALMLYLDFLNIFLFMLHLFGSRE